MLNHCITAFFSASLVFMSACGGTSQQQVPVSVTPETAEPFQEVVEKTPTPNHVKAEPTFQSPFILQHIGKHRSILVSVDWGLIQDSPFFALLDKYLLQSSSSQLANMTSTCNFSPVDVLSSITLAWRDPLDLDDLLIAMTGDVTQAELEECVTKLGSAEDTRRLKNSFWPEDGVVLFADGSRASALKNEVDHGSILDHVEMMATLRNIRDPLTAIWAAGFLSSSAKQAIAGTGMISAPNVFYLAVNLEDGVDAELTLQFSSALEADKTLQFLKSMLPMLTMQTGRYSKLTSSLVLNVHGNDVIAELQLSRLEVEDLVKDN